jgi:hypothetical protein
MLNGYDNPGESVEPVARVSATRHGVTGTKPEAGTISSGTPVLRVGAPGRLPFTCTLIALAPNAAALVVAISRLEVVARVPGTIDPGLKLTHEMPVGSGVAQENVRVSVIFPRGVTWTVASATPERSIITGRGPSEETEKSATSRVRSVSRTVLLASVPTPWRLNLYSPIKLSLAARVNGVPADVGVREAGDGVQVVGGAVPPGVQLKFTLLLYAPSAMALPWNIPFAACA